MKKNLDVFSNIVLPISVLMEILVHFRDNLDLLYDFVKFFLEKKFKLYNNVSNYGLLDTQYFLLGAMGKDLLNSYVKKTILTQKLEMESIFHCPL